MPLLDAIPHILGLRGRPRHRPRRLFADRGYDFDKYRRLVRARGITPKIARRGTPHGSGLGKTRWVVERTFACLHQFKRLRIRYEIHAKLHLALLQLACKHHLLETTQNLILKRTVRPLLQPTGGEAAAVAASASVEPEAAAHMSATPASPRAPHRKAAPAAPRRQATTPAAPTQPRRRTSYAVA